MRWPKSPESRLQALSLACALAAFLLAAAGYAYGIAHRFNHWMIEAVEYNNIKLGAAVSEYVYGVSLGRASHTQVWEALKQGGFTIETEHLTRLGTRFPDNLSDVRLLNEGLKRAATLDRLREAKALVGDIKPVEPDDLGMVDFFRLAFEVFGLEVQSFYNLYYLLYFISIGLFVAAFWRRAEAMAVLLLLVACHFLALAFLVGGVPRDMGFHVATPYSQRFVSVLGVVSAFHLCLTLLWPPRLRVFAVAAFAVQTVIVFLVFMMRRSAVWEMLWAAAVPLVFLALVIAWRFGGLRRWPKYDSAETLLRRGLSWPAVTLAALLAVLVLVNDARYNAVYRFSNEFLTHHTVWNSIHVGLTVHPDWEQRYGAALKDAKGTIPRGDAIPSAAAGRWLRDHYGLTESYLLSPVWGWQHRTMERVLKEALFDFVKSNRRFMLALQLYYKPKLFISNYLKWNESTIRTCPWWGLLLLGGALVLYAVVCYRIGRAGCAGLNRVTGLVIAGMVLAVAPAIAIFPNHSTMSDQVLMLNAGLLSLAGLAIARATAWISWVTGSAEPVQGPQAT